MFLVFLGNVLLSSPLKGSFADVEFLVESFSFSSQCYPTAFQTPLFLMRNQLLILLRIPRKWWVAFLSSSFLVFSHITIHSIIIIDLSAYLWVYPPGFLWISLMCGLMIFMKFGKISDIILSVLFSLCLPSENPIMCMLVWLEESKRSLSLYFSSSFCHILQIGHLNYLFSNFPLLSSVCFAVDIFSVFIFSF